MLLADAVELNPFLMLRVRRNLVIGALPRHCRGPGLQRAWLADPAARQLLAESWATRGDGREPFRPSRYPPGSRVWGIKAQIGIEISPYIKFRSTGD